MDYEKNVESMDALIRALSGTISGPAGPKDGDRECQFLHPAARMMRGLPAQEGALYLKNAPILP
jgi:hypothetical protein